MAASVALVVEALQQGRSRRRRYSSRLAIATGAAVFLPLLVRLEPELIGALRGFARHGRRPNDDRGQVSSGKGGGLVPERPASR